MPHLRPSLPFALALAALAACTPHGASPEAAGGAASQPAGSRSTAQISTRLDATGETAEVLTDVAGRVEKVGNLGFGLVPDGEPGTRYQPDDLPQEFQVDGLEVVFSGEVGTIDPAGRRWGTPLRLTDIRRR